MGGRIRRQLWLVHAVALWPGCSWDWSGSVSPSTLETFDVACTDLGCGWQVEAGRLEQTAAWHADEPAFSFAEAGTSVVLHSPATEHPRCLGFELMANIEEGAQLQLELDFNADGLDATLPMPSTHWQRKKLWVRAPDEYRSLHLRLRKLGTARAVLQSFVLGQSPAEDKCSEPAITLPVDSPCTLDSTCSSGRCLAGTCAMCALGGCAEGERCRADQECMDGFCAAGVCRACAKAGTCGALERCSNDEQCASKNCVHGAVPSMSDFPGLDGVCGECKADSECPSGMCVVGRCSACRVDANCPPDQECRYQHAPEQPAFDALTRACAPRRTSESPPLPRGALCERGDDCGERLLCLAPEGQAKRCGIACRQALDCGVGEICGAPGAIRKYSLSDAIDAGTPEGLVREPVLLLPAWNEVSGRVRTCYDYRGRGQPCAIHDQCTGLFGTECCSGGRCSADAIDRQTGLCVAQARLPYLYDFSY